MLPMTLFAIGGTSSAPLPALTYVTHLESSAGSSTVTFTAASIGTASSDRLVIVSVGASKAIGAWSANPITSLTIGGNAATLAGNQKLTGGVQGSAVAAIYCLTVPSGTSADIVVNLAASYIGCGVVIWSSTGLNSSTPTATADDNTDPLSQSLTVSSDGFGIGFAINDNSSGQSWAWSGMTERSDADNGGATHGICSGADTTTSGSVSVTATPSAFNRPALVLASWR